MIVFARFERNHIKEAGKLPFLYKPERFYYLEIIFLEELMNYKAYFTGGYSGIRDGGEEFGRGFPDVPLNFMMVYGGAKRYIDFTSTDDISITSELEQARTFKNIWLYLSSTPNGDDMKTALYLSEIYAMKKQRFYLSVTIERFEGGKALEGVCLLADAILTQPPKIDGNSLLITANLGPTIQLSRGTVTNHFVGFNEGDAYSKF